MPIRPDKTRWRPSWPARRQRQFYGNSWTYRNFRTVRAQRPFARCPAACPFGKRGPHGHGPPSTFAPPCPPNKRARKNIFQNRQGAEALISRAMIKKIGQRQFGTSLVDPTAGMSPAPRRPVSALLPSDISQKLFPDGRDSQAMHGTHWTGGVMVGKIKPSKKS